MSFFYFFTLYLSLNYLRIYQQTYNILEITNNLSYNKNEKKKEPCANIAPIPFVEPLKRR